MGQYDDMPRPDFHGVYGSTNRVQTAGKATSCNDCKHDKATAVDGEHLLCQRKGGGKKDMSCWVKREMKQGGKVVAHVELRGRPRGRPVGSCGGNGKVPTRMHKGRLLADIAKESGLKLSTLHGRINYNPDISLERLTRPADIAGKKPTKMHKGMLVADIATQSGISRSAIKYRIKSNPDISLKDLMKPTRKPIKDRV